MNAQIQDRVEESVELNVCVHVQAYQLRERKRANILEEKKMNDTLYE